MSSDRLSGLPEEIISHILSLMPTKYAVQTSVLSKRWRYSWIYVSNLDFVDIHPHSIHGEKTLTKFVDQILMRCKTSQLNLFRLHFSKIPVQTRSLLEWINKAIKLNVNELDIRVDVNLVLPLRLFTCKTLTKLRLDIISIYDWKCPCEVNLPCLKTLDVTIYSNPFVVAFKLIDGCPVLENLSLKVLWFSMDGDCQFNIPTLKRLKVKWVDYSHSVYNVVLNVPNLEHLFVGGALCSVYKMKDVSSLVEASISLRRILSFRVWVKLVKRLIGVKSLSVKIRCPLINFETLFTPRLPIFPHLTYFELKGFWHTELILQFLENSPELKHLCIGKSVDPFSEESIEDRWVKPKLVPACMLTKLTTIKFLYCDWWNCDKFVFLKYMLGNSKVLKTVSITLDKLRFEEQMQMWEALLKFPRASRCCEIHFLS